MASAAESDNECESSGNLMTFQASAPDTEGKTDEADREKHLPPMRNMPVVYGFYSQSVAPPNSEIDTWCHSNDPSAVETVHSVLHD